MSPTFETTSGVLCAIENCGGGAFGSAVDGQRLCRRHRSRWKRHGDPLAGRKPNGEAAHFMEEVVLAYEGNDCLVWPHGRIPNGYAKLWINGRTELAHRYVCQKTHGPPPTPEHEAAHSCGNGTGGCVTKRHLSWKTHLENIADKAVHGTQIRGEQQHLAKLSERDVIAIRSLRGRVTQVALAKQFGVTQSTVSSIHTGESWGWLK